MKTQLLELYVAAAVAGADVKLANRRDSAIDGVSARDGKPRVVTSVLCSCGEEGYLVALLEGELVLTANLPALLAMLVPHPVNIPVPAGKQLTFYVHSTDSTGSCAVVVGVQSED